MVIPFIGPMFFDLQWNTVVANQIQWLDSPPQYGTDLWYHLQLRSAVVAVSAGIVLYVNSNPLNTQNHYQGFRAVNAAATYVGTGTAALPIITGSTAPADSYGSIFVHIQNFRSSRQKITHCFSCDEDTTTAKNLRWGAIKRHGVSITGALTDPIVSVGFQDAAAGGVNLLDGTLRRAVSA